MKRFIFFAVSLLLTFSISAQNWNQIGQDTEGDIGQYKKQVNLEEYSKVIYFLEITTNLAEIIRS
tara:strand:+ start:903 stop:1097 length:195 start_codon:yes stop_codon:yes gene_type:complete